MGWQSETSGRHVLLTAVDKPIASGNPSAILVTETGVVQWMDAAGKNTHQYTLAAGVHPLSISQLMANTAIPVLGLYD